MTRAEALKLLPSDEDEFEEPTHVPEEALRHLNCEDIPKGALIGVGETIGNVTRVVWDGHFFRLGKNLAAHCDYSSWRKYWEKPLGMTHYLDLVRRSIETRQRSHRDVELLDWDEEDSSVINLIFELHELPRNLGEAFEIVKSRIAELEGPAEEASLKAGALATEIGQRISGLGTTSLNKLIRAVQNAKTTDEKGRSLEELVARLFGSIRGLTVADRVRTETEEIDLTVLNDCDDVRFKRESVLFLVECKNWTGKCGKDEFVTFREKLLNRKGRCSLGFLVSWNGFADTIRKEMLRGSREDALIVPVTGKQLREMVSTGRPLDILGKAWLNAVYL